MGNHSRKNKASFVNPLSGVYKIASPPTPSGGNRMKLFGKKIKWGRRERGGKKRRKGREWKAKGKRRQGVKEGKGKMKGKRETKEERIEIKL